MTKTHVEKIRSPGSARLRSHRAKFLALALPLLGQIAPLPAQADLSSVIYPHPWFPPDVPTLLPDDSYIDYTYFSGGTGYVVPDPETPTTGLEMLTVEQVVRHKTNNTAVTSYTNNFGCATLQLNSFCGLPDTFTSFFCWGESFCAPASFDGIYGEWHTGLGGQLHDTPTDVRSGPTDTTLSCGMSTAGLSYYEWYYQFGGMGCGMHAAEELGAGSLCQINLTITPECASGVDRAALASAASSASASYTTITPSLSSLTPSGGSFNANGEFQFSFAGQIGSMYTIQCSSDLRVWRDCGTVTLSGPTGSFADSAAAPLRFYRVQTATQTRSDAYGYVKLALSPGYSLIANPLFAPDMSIGALLPNAADGTTLQFLGNSVWNRTATHSSGAWDHPEWHLVPGQGAMIYVGAPVTISFIGEVVQGVITNSVPSGTSLSSSPVAQSGSVDALGLAGLVDGDHLLKWDGSAYATFTRSSGSWQPSVPVVSVGEAVVIEAASVAGWTRVFSAQGGCSAPTDGVAWWPLEGDETDVAGGNDGAISNTLAFASGALGLGIDLSGKPGGVSIDSANALNFGPGADFSIEAWVQPQQVTTTYGVMDILDKRYSPNTSQAQGYELCLSSGRLAFQMNDGGNIYSPLSVGPTGSDLRDGQWHHVAVTVQRASSSGLNLYVDGALVGSYNPTSKQGDLSTISALLIGLHPTPSLDCNFRGGIDEPAVYSRALSESEIQAISAGAGKPSAGLVSWWPLGGDSIDVVGAHNGVLSNTVAFAAAEVGQGLNLVTKPGGVIVNTAAPLNFGAGVDFSIECWVRPAYAITTYDIMDIVDKRYSPNASQAQGYEICLSGGKIAFQMNDGANIYSPLSVGPAGADLRDGNWHHVAAAVQRSSTSGLKLYVDGALVGTYDPTSKQGDLGTTSALLIGLHPTPSVDCNFRGQVDEVSVYNTALSSSRVQAIYAAGSARKCGSN